MRAIIESSELSSLNAVEVSPAVWTAIIPAAGRASRLNTSLPKILYPILEKPILYWLLELLDSLCERIVVVASPTGRNVIESSIRRKSGALPVKLCVQPEPIGMANAVWVAREQVVSPNCLVLWGDQAALRRETIVSCMRAHQLRPNAHLTIPTVMRRNPYIHFERDASSKICRVLQAREEKIAHEIGESDCGAFFFNTDKLFNIIECASGSPSTIGAQTGEFNLLPLLPRFEGEPGNVVTLRIAGEDEAIGINTLEEAAAVSDILRRRTLENA